MEDEHTLDEHTVAAIKKARLHPSLDAPTAASGRGVWGQGGGGSSGSHAGLATEEGAGPRCPGRPVSSRSAAVTIGPAVASARSSTTATQALGRTAFAASPWSARATC